MPHTVHQYSYQNPRSCGMPSRCETYKFETNKKRAPRKEKLNLIVNCFHWIVARFDDHKWRCLGNLSLTLTEEKFAIALCYYTPSFEPQKFYLQSWFNLRERTICWSLFFVVVLTRFVFSFHLRSFVVLPFLLLPWKWCWPKVEVIKSWR